MWKYEKSDDGIDRKYSILNHKKYTTIWQFPNVFKHPYDLFLWFCNSEKSQTISKLSHEIVKNYIFENIKIFKKWYESPWIEKSVQENLFCEEGTQTQRQEI